jgi:hypothetical protein
MTRQLRRAAAAWAGQPPVRVLCADFSGPEQEGTDSSVHPQDMVLASHGLWRSFWPVAVGGWGWSAVASSAHLHFRVG